jgi:hypothetical protein
LARLENCPTCGNETSENAELCPSCGEPLAAGWADEIQKQKQLAEEAELEAKKKSKLAAIKKAKAKKKARLKKKLVIGSIILLAILLLVGKSKYDDYYSRNLKTIDPVAFQNTVKELEAKASRIPASEFDENIRLYIKLQNLNPDNKRYAEKIEFYTNKKKDAAFALEKKAALARQKEARAKQEKEEAERKAKVAAEEIRKRKGFHCLSSWDGSHRSVNKYVEKNLRDPDSFDHIETRITPVDKNGEHKLIMSYRAKNGFGGLTTGITVATIQNSDCSAVINSNK